MPRYVQPEDVMHQMNEEHLRSAVYHLEAYVASRQWNASDSQVINTEIIPIIGTLKEMLS